MEEDLRRGPPLDRARRGLEAPKELELRLVTPAGCHGSGTRRGTGTEVPVRASPDPRAAAGNDDYCQTMFSVYRDRM